MRLGAQDTSGRDGPPGSTFSSLFPSSSPSPPADTHPRARARRAPRRDLPAHGRLARAQGGEQAGEGEIATTDVELKLEEDRLAEATAARDLAASAGGGRRARRSARLEGARRRAAELGRRLAGLYRLGRQGYLRLFLSLKPDAGSSPRSGSCATWRGATASIDRYHRGASEPRGERDRLVARREEIERWIDQEQARRRRQLVRARAPGGAPRPARRTRARLWWRGPGSWPNSEHKLSAFLDLLYGKGPESPAGKPMQDFRGVLDWPVEGKVTAGFGPLLDPRYRTRVPHNGVDVAETAAGAEVRAVFPGKVLFAAPFEGLRHDRRRPACRTRPHPLRRTRAMRVNKEDMVSLGDVVGSASDKLYFEIRVENRPEDPLSWLR